MALRAYRPDDDEQRRKFPTWITLLISLVALTADLICAALFARWFVDWLASSLGQW